MANYGLQRDEKDRPPKKSDLQVSHQTDRFDEGYVLGVRHGIEQERERWMNQIHDIVTRAITEALNEQ